jgi:glycosyltransferase 2 family protein
LERLGRNLALFIAIGATCYGALFFWGQGGKVWDVLLGFPVIYLPLLLVLASLNYVVRYVRWQIYLDALSVHIGFWKSFQIFMAGLTMTISPGKIGEALKAQFLSREISHPWSRGLPVVFAERLSDLMGVVVLVGLGVNVLPVGRTAALLGTAVCVFFVIVIVTPVLFHSMVNLLGKLPKMSGPSERLLEMHENVSRLLSLRLMAASLILSCAAWFMECLVLYFTVAACKGHVGGLQITFIYALSTLAGALSVIPGGLLVTEGSMIGLLMVSGLEKSLAISATFIVRLCTLWFAVLLGIVFLLVFQRASQKTEAFHIKPKG